MTVPTAATGSVRVSAYVIPPNTGTGTQYRWPPASPAWTRKVKPSWKAPKFRAYTPGEYDAGQVITWSDSNSARRTGTIWSAGPDPRTVWVSPDDAARSFANMVVVNTPKPGVNDAPFEFGRWYHPDPSAMTTLSASYVRAA